MVKSKLVPFIQETEFVDGPIEAALSRAEPQIQHLCAGLCKKNFQLQRKNGELQAEILTLKAAFNYTTAKYERLKPFDEATADER